MPVFYSPAGNPEVWEIKPDGYVTPEEWEAAHPVSAHPALPLEQVRSFKLIELKAAYDRALAGAVALADPSPVNVSLEAALWAVEDAEGLSYLRERLAAEYARLAAAIEACESVEDLEKVKVVFGV